MAITKPSKEACNAEALKHALAAPGGIRELIESRQAAEAVVSLLATLAPDEQKEILASQDAIWRLTHYKQGEAVMALIAALAPEAQKELLAVPQAILKLAFYGQAAAVMALIAPLAPKAQKEVLAAKGAVRGLVGNGRTEAVFALIAAFAPGEQKQLLDRGDIVWQLREIRELAVLKRFQVQHGWKGKYY